ncbi:MAG: NAD(P)/FAD-dependent oxidoreductase [Anaerolineae bacterium]|nr:NAD(P)/FAD-dependent oxidoreductase [Anaerolineae bacterium]
MNQHKSDYDTIIIGGGQAGLSVGYYLKQQGRNFVILDASKQTGDVWRNRWDSLHLFTPARYCGLDGMPFPASPHSFPTKDAMADYLESYARRFDLPVRSDTRVDKLSRAGDRFVVTAGNLRFKSDNVVVAMAEWQQPRIPAFADELHDDIIQLHSQAYRNPSQLREGGVLVVGAANSGAEIAQDVARDHTTWLSGNHPGHIPFRIETAIAQRLLIPFVLRILFHRIMTVKTPIGRKTRSQVKAHGMPLVRTKPVDLEAAGIKRVSKTVGTKNGLPVLADGHVLDVANVIWCTGFNPGFSWIDLPIFDKDGEPIHERGVVASEPGLYFIGLTFIYAASSSEIHGVGRDAKYVADHIATQSADTKAISKDSLKNEPHSA